AVYTAPKWRTEFESCMFSERDASRVLNQLTTAVVVLDEGLLLAGANSAAESLITTSVYKLQGQPLARLFPDAATFCRTVASVFDEPRAFTERDLLLHRPNQEPVKVDCSVAPWWRGSTRPAGV